MDHSQRVYRISRAAQDIIQERVGAPTNKGGPEEPSPSIVLSSIVLRYDAIMRSVEQSYRTKFDPEEIDAIFSWVECQPGAHKTMTRIDKADHSDSMLDAIVTGADLMGPTVLDTNRRRSLIRILKNNLRIAEMFSLADRIALRLSKRRKSSLTDVV